MATETGLNEPIPQIAAANPFAIISQDYARKKAIADLLLRNGQQEQQGQMVSGHYIAPSGFSQLGRIASILASNKLNSSATGGQLGLAQLLTQNRGSEMSGVLAKLKSGDRMGAIVSALTSNDPQVQALGKGFLEKSPGSAELAGLVGKVTPGSISAVQNTGDFSQADPHVNGPVQPGPGGVPVSINQVTGKPDFGPVANHMNTQVTQLPANVAGVEAIKHAYDRLDPAYEQALNAQQSYTALNQAESALKHAITGTGSNVRIEMTRALQTLGMPSDQIAKLSSTTDLRNALTLAAAQTAKSQTGARVSNYEEQIFQKVGGADPNSSPDEMQAAISIGKAKAANNIEQFNRQLTAAGNDPDVKPHLSTYADIKPLDLGQGPYAKDPQTGLYRVDDQAMSKLVAPTGAQPGAPAAQPTAAPQAPAGLQLPPGFSYVGPAP